jgi:hypothetical protein
LAQARNPYSLLRCSVLTLTTGDMDSGLAQERAPE